MKAKELKSSHNKGDKIDMLFLITAPTAEFRKTKTHGEHFLISGDAHALAFSDRPYRLAKTLAGGALHFAHFYNKSDFKSDPPNVTFAGLHHGTSSESVTIFELGSPILSGANVLLPVVQWIGDEKPVLVGEFSNVSFVVDNIFGDILETVGAVVGTGLACTVGEVATMGADTALCGAGVVATAGAITNVATD